MVKPRMCKSWLSIHIEKLRHNSWAKWGLQVVLVQIGKCIIRGLHHQPGLWGWDVVSLRIYLVLMLLRTGTTKYELRGKFQDLNLLIVIELIGQTGAWWAQHNLKQPFYSQEAFYISSPYTGWKGAKCCPHLLAHCLVSSRHSTSTYLIKLNFINGTFRANYQL